MYTVFCKASYVTFPDHLGLGQDLKKRRVRRRMAKKMTRRMTRRSTKRRIETGF